MKADIKYYDVDVCVCCGNIIPEGGMVCSACQKIITQSPTAKIKCHPEQSKG